MPKLMNRRCMTALIGSLMLTPLLALPLGNHACAQETVKIGLLAPFSGPFAGYGTQFWGGLKTYLSQHGGRIGGRKVEIIRKDTTGPSPELGQRLTQELIVQDKVDFIAIGGFTPESITAAMTASRAKVPLLVLNASATDLTAKAPYSVRVSFSFRQVTTPFGRWASRQGFKRVVTIVTDYAPGLDAEKSFIEGFQTGSGKVIDSLRVPLRNPEFAPFFQRIKDAKPDAVFAWAPAGDQSIALLKAFRDRGLPEAGVKLLALGDMLDSESFADLGDTLLHTPSTLHYSLAHDSQLNQEFIATFAKASGATVKPTFMAVAAYDGAALISKAVQAQTGKLDKRKSLAAMLGVTLESPRGTIYIDPKTRDITQTVYIRTVEKQGGELRNVETEHYDSVKP